MIKVEITNTWNDFFKYFDDSIVDIYFKEEYVKLYENKIDKAECFIYQENNNIFLILEYKSKYKKKAVISDG